MKYPNAHNVKRHYWRRRMTGYSAKCASHRHGECRMCECTCHERQPEAIRGRY